MSEFKGTQGKFFAQSEEMESGDVSVCVCDQYGNSIAFCGRSLGLPERNAKLFAAAPELLQALQEMVSAIKITLRVGHERIVELGGDCDSPEVTIKGHSEIARAEAAISKALGQ